MAFSARLASSVLTAAVLAGVLATAWRAAPPDRSPPEPTLSPEATAPRLQPLAFSPPPLEPAPEPIGPALAPRPSQRPGEVATSTTATPGAICGDAGLIGVALPKIVEPVRGCYASAPVELASAAAVEIAPPVVVVCGVAERLSAWLEQDLQPAARARLGAEIAAIEQVAGYDCRTRNNQPNARLSQHAFAAAIDIAGFRLTDGRRVGVETDWGDSPAGGFLRQAAETACGRFATVLGPESDVFHRDHFHLDVTARKAPYCR